MLFLYECSLLKGHTSTLGFRVTLLGSGVRGNLGSWLCVLTDYPPCNTCDIQCNTGDIQYMWDTIQGSKVGFVPQELAANMVQLPNTRYGVRSGNINTAPIPGHLLLNWVS
jgi:hypothetical protein